MAYSMGSIVLQAASDGRRLAFPHSWIMIHEPAKWAGWQSTTAAAQHLERLKQMQDQIYKILSSRSGKPLRQIIRDTKRTDFYLDAQKALEYGLIDAVVAGELPEPKPAGREQGRAAPVSTRRGRREAEAARERTSGGPREAGMPARAVSNAAAAKPDGSSTLSLPRRRATLRAGARRCRRPNAASASSRARARAGCGRPDRAQARRRTRPSCAALPRSARAARRAAPAGTA